MTFVFNLFFPPQKGHFDLKMYMGVLYGRYVSSRGRETLLGLCRPDLLKEPAKILLRGGLLPRDVIDYLIPLKGDRPSLVSAHPGTNLLSPMGVLFPGSGVL